MDRIVCAALMLCPLAISVASCGGNGSTNAGSGGASTAESAGSTSASVSGAGGSGGGAGGTTSSGGSSGRGAGYDHLGFFPCAADAKDQVTCYQSLAAWLGRSTTPSIPYVTLMTDATDPSTMAGNGWGYTVEPGSFETLSPRPTLVISVPLAFESDAGCGLGTTSTTCFDPVVAGNYDGDYSDLVNYFENAGITDVIIRLGWEFDGSWMPWSAQNNFAQFKAAYRHVHDLMKGLMPSLKFDLCADSLSYDTTDAVMAIWNQAYPGDGYVDIFGMDVYYSPNSFPDFSQSYLPYLKIQEQFAKSKGASVSYPEWGQKNLADDPKFIDDMADWFDSLPTTGPGRLEYHSYFNQDTSAAEGANGAVQLYDTITNQPTSPNSAAEFRKRFGGP